MRLKRLLDRLKKDFNWDTLCLISHHLEPFKKGLDCSHYKHRLHQGPVQFKMNYLKGFSPQRDLQRKTLLTIARRWAQAALKKASLLLCRKQQKSVCAVQQWWCTKEPAEKTVLIIRWVFVSNLVKQVHCQSPLGPMSLYQIVHNRVCWIFLICWNIFYRKPFASWVQNGAFYWNRLRTKPPQGLEKLGQNRPFWRSRWRNFEKTQAKHFETKNYSLRGKRVFTVFTEKPRNVEKLIF